MSEQEREARRKRLGELREKSHRFGDVYPARIDARVLAATEGRWTVHRVRETYEQWDEDKLKLANPRVAVCGRITAIRRFGRLSFMTLLDDGARLQISVDASAALPVRELLELLDVGDIVAVGGNVWRTKRNELTIGVGVMQVLAKSLHPLPEKWHGLQDVEARYRQRYLDLLVNPEAREMVRMRARAIRAVRAFLDGRGFLEVETPILQPLYGGGSARPFVTRYNVYEQDVYLRIADELYLKRLVIGGLDRVYEIGHSFRNEGVSRKRNPEFTMMECYQAYADYRDMMELVQALLQHVVRETHGGTEVSYRGQTLDFSGDEWPRLRLADAIRDATGVDVLASPDLPSLRKAVIAADLDPGDAPTWGQLVDHLFSEQVEPKLVQPTFLVDYPVELSPLAKRSSDDDRLVERFELFAAGMELANAFSELNDPDDQRARFEEQRQARSAGDEEAHPLDEDFLAALEHGMPPTGGLGVGIDRLVMLLADAAHLREVLLFPYMRPERT